MSPEVGGGGLGLGAPEEKVPNCLKGPKTTYTTIEIAEKQSKINKKGPFSLYIGSPGSHPVNGIDGARRGRSLPVPPGFSSHAYIYELRYNWVINYTPSCSNNLLTLYLWYTAKAKAVGSTGLLQTVQRVSQKVKSV